VQNHPHASPPHVPAARRKGAAEPRTFRRVVVLTAAYAIALQAVMAGFAMLTLAGRPALDICSPAGNGPSPPGDCLLCPLTCGATGLDSVAPPEVVAAPAVPMACPACRAPASAPCSAPRLLPPSRAPPAA
jgi:hypothetical protein